MNGSDMIRNLNKVRIVALYIQFREGVPDEDRRRLYQHARLSLAEQDAVNALLLMGVRISRVSDWCRSELAIRSPCHLTGARGQRHQEENQTEIKQGGGIRTLTV